MPDVCGPLGDPTHIENFGHCVCLAGGFGVDGPDFDAHEVDFDELVRRQQMYRSEEKEVLERYVRSLRDGEVRKKSCQLAEGVWQY